MLLWKLEFSHHLGIEVYNLQEKDADLVLVLFKGFNKYIYFFNCSGITAIFILSPQVTDLATKKISIFAETLGLLKQDALGQSVVQHSANLSRG